MKSDAVHVMPRRNFLKLAGAAGVCGLSQTGFAAASKQVFLIVEPENSTVASVPAMSAIAQLGKALGAKGVKHEIARSAEAAEGAALCIVVANADSLLAQGFPRGATSSGPEGLRMTPGRVGGAPAVLVFLPAILRRLPSMGSSNWLSGSDMATILIQSRCS